MVEAVQTQSVEDRRAAPQYWQEPFAATDRRTFPDETEVGGLGGNDYWYGDVL